jgi:IS30 family transposase
MSSRQLTADPSSEEPFPQLRLHFTDDVQERYEIARPLLLGRLTSAAARARETNTHPQTVRRYVRRFERLGMQGLFGERAVVPKGHTVPDSVRQEVIRLKTMHPPLHHREIANIIYVTLGCRIDHKTVAAIIRAHPIAVQNRSCPFKTR